MKKYLIVTVFLLTISTAHSQILISILLGDQLNTGKVEFGLDGGINMASMQGIDGAGNISPWNLGFYFDIKLNDPAWMIHTGVIVKSTMGSENAPLYSLNNADLDRAFSGGSVNTRLQYFNVPVMLKYRFENHFFVEGGIMLGLLYKGTDEFVNSVQETDDLSYERDVKDAYHPLDGGLMIGAGYRLLGGNGMNLGVRYYYGLVDVYIDDNTPNVYNRALYFTVGIPIGAGKPAEN